MFDRRLEQVVEVMTSALRLADPSEGLRSAVLGLGDLQATDRAAAEVLASADSAERRLRGRETIEPVVGEILRPAWPPDGCGRTSR
ncbi:MAG: hypothetical protein ACR2M5_10360 [Nakamurella sp.]